MYRKVLNISIIFWRGNRKCRRQIKKTNKKESAKKANEQKSDTVQTGDHSNVFVYVATLLIAGAAAVVAFFRRRNA